MSNMFKYSTTFNFEAVASASPISKTEISQASITNLEGLIPKNIDLERNIDLLGVAFNAAVVNKFNKNGDGIDSNTALAIKDYFVHKPTNIEHNRDQVVGHIVSSGFSSYEDSVIMSDEQVKSQEEPFNISLAAVVYKNSSPQFSDLLESSADENGDFSTIISTSWELGFNEFAVSIGSENLKDNEVVYGEDVEKYKEHLVAFGGSGKLEDGRTVHRLVTGEVYPLGVAFTTKPAADVNGVLLADREENSKDSTSTNNAFLNKIQEKSSHPCKNNVILPKESNLDNTMETEKIINSLEALLDEKRRANDFSDEAVASISKLVNDVIIEKSSEWKSQVEEAQSKADQLEKSQAEMAEKYDLLQKDFEDANKNLEQMKIDNAERDAQEAFNSRMESLSSDYDLSEEDLEIVASELKSVPVGIEAFAEYKEKFMQIWSHKNKEFIASKEAEIEARILAEVEKRTSGEEKQDSAEVVDAALENVEESEELIPNNNSESLEEESLSDRFEKAFSQENISIKY
jgi:hypothetical protein